MHATLDLGLKTLGTSLLFFPEDRLWAYLWPAADQWLGIG